MRIDMAVSMGTAVMPGVNGTGEKRADRQEDMPVMPGRSRKRDVYEAAEEELSAGIYDVRYEDGRRVVDVNEFGADGGVKGNAPDNKTYGEDVSGSEKAVDNGDKPDTADRTPGEKKSPRSPEKSGGKGAEKCTGNTDKVDREIKALKEKIKRLRERAEKAEGDERERLSKELAAAEAELARKDCDSYRREHSEFR
ncbi:MAG: hypothetical protein NC078_08375 [Ruminococcus sp.]|nr:hypothetical protein [Ruminococcus sp.]